jgi:hypothetical protein
VKEQLKIYPYFPGGVGTSIGGYLSGGTLLAPLANPQTPRFVEGTGMEINTVPPNDFAHYDSSTC